ncbi:MAG: hypothetical protein IH849_00145 [Acidobacteria bacterium]|nr:hypothetical protein [Acidobacteriota bacterium]
MNVGRASKSAGIAIVVLSLASATAGGAAMDAAKARQRQHGAVFVSGYVDGVHGFNLMDPENPVTVAWYDTYLGSLNEDFTPVFNGTFGIDVRNADGLIVASDSTSGFWAFRMEGFQGWSGEQWGYPNISSAQDWDNGPTGRRRR